MIDLIISYYYCSIVPMGNASMYVIYYKEKMHILYPKKRHLYKVYRKTRKKH